MKYKVIGKDFEVGDDFESLETNDPDMAIEKWMALQRKYPMGVWIHAKSEASVELLDWARSNIDKVTRYYNSNEVNKFSSWELEKILDWLSTAKGVDKEWDDFDGEVVEPFGVG